MKNILFLLFSLLISVAMPSLATESSEVPKSVSPQQYSADDFFKTTTVFGSSINHDVSAALVISDQSGVLMPIDTQLTEAQRLNSPTQKTMQLAARAGFRVIAEFSIPLIRVAMNSIMCTLEKKTDQTKI